MNEFKILSIICQKNHTFTATDSETSTFMIALPRIIHDTTIARGHETWKRWASSDHHKTTLNIII